LIFPSVVALSETYDNLLADHLTRTLGVDWEVHEGRKAKNAKWEIAGVPAALTEPTPVMGRYSTPDFTDSHYPGLDQIREHHAHS
jgi:hypothetical protein